MVRQTILINNVLIHSTNLLYAFIVPKKVILLENAQKIRKASIEKEGHASVVDQFDILSKIAQSGMEIKKENLTIINSFD